MNHFSSVIPVAWRRVVAGTAAVVLGVMGVAACGGSGGEADAGSGEGGGTLNVTLGTTAYAEAIKRYAGEFTEQSGIEVSISTYGYEQLSDQYKVKLDGGASDIDVMMYRPPEEQRLFSSNGWMVDLSDRVTADAAWDWTDFQASTRDAVSLDGAVYGVPIMTERHIVYYRADVLAEAGIEPPGTLEELRAAAAAVHDPDNDFYGISMRGQRSAAVSQLSSFLFSYGTDFAIDGQATVGSPEAIEAYQLYGGLLRDYGPPGSTNMTWIEASAIFAQGNAAFYVDADSQAYVFLDPEKSAVAEVFDYAPFPSGPAGARPYNITPWAIGINSASTNVDAAWQFIEWATSAEMFARIMAEDANPSPRQSTWEDDEATADYPEALIEIVRLYGEIGVGHDRPEVIEVGEARDIIGVPVVTAIEGGDVEGTAATAAAEYQALLDQQP